MGWEALAYELRRALRRLRRRRRVTALAVVTLALGLGPITAVYSVVSAVVLRKLPFERPEELACVWAVAAHDGAGQQRVSLPDAHDLRARCGSFRGWAHYLTGTYSVSDDHHNEELATAAVSADALTTLGVPVLLGRVFKPADAPGDAEHVALISFRLWRRWFGGERSALGSTVIVRGVSHRIVGVLPEHCGLLPVVDGTTQRFDIWTVLADRDIPRSFGLVHLIGRRAPGVTSEQARAEVDAVARQLEREYPASNRDRRFQLVPLTQQILGSLDDGLMLALIAATVVVLIAVSNVTNLLLAAGLGERREIAIRLAIGAPPVRLALSLALESVLLAVAGGAAGVAAAYWALRALLALAPPGIPRLDEAVIDGRVVLFTFAAAIAAGLGASLVPALQQLRVRLASTLDARGWGPAIGGGRASELITIVQVALAVVLLVGSSLVYRSYDRLLAVDPGLDAKRILAVRLRLPRDEADLERRLQQHIEALPGVAGFAAIGYLPFAHPGWEISYSTDADGPAVAHGEGHLAFIQPVTPGLFAAAGIELLEGRPFAWSDLSEGASSMVISRGLAQQAWPGASAIGHQIWLSLVKDKRPYEVVGVVADTLQRALDERSQPTLYFVDTRRGNFATFAVVRSTGDPAALAGSVVAAIHEVAPAAAVLEATPLEEAVLASAARPRLLRWLLALLSGLATGLALIGTYGVMSCRVAARVPTLAVRLSLGATPAQIVTLELVECLRSAFAGVALGTLGALLLSRLLAGILYGTSPTDPGAFAVAGALMLAAVLLAGVPPAVRAGRTDPLVLLRQ